MARLGLSFLGAPRVQRGGKALAFRTRKALALVIYLVVEAGWHSREKLITLLWPESDDQRGHMSLRRALASLRKTLGDTISPPPGYILVELDSLSFNFQADFELDLVHLDKAAELAHESESAHPRHFCEHIDQLEAAVGLYRGDFLEGFTLKAAQPFDDWASLQREIYHRRMDIICDRLSQRQIESGQTHNALDTCDRWIRHNELSETAYRRAMRLHFAAGDRAAALAVYKLCTQTLALELGLEPAPATTALAEYIQAEAPTEVSRKSSEAAGTAAMSAVLGKPFVGREAEHGQLVALFHAIKGAGSHVATLLGEAGIGKTRLASEFMSWATGHGAQVLASRSFETSSDLPFQPWTDILRSHPVEEALSREFLSDVWLGELSRLLPELLDRLPGISPLRVNESAAQARLFEAVTRLGHAMADRAPLVIFIDDLHWSDTASLDLLHYAARRWSDSGLPVLLLLSIRTESLSSRPDLVQWLVDFGRELELTRLELDALTGDQTHRWVQDLAGIQADGEVVDAFSQWLYTETEGQPFHIQAVLETLLEQEILGPSLDGWSAIDFREAVRGAEGLSGFLATGVRDVIVARLAQLSSRDFTLLAAAAVLGRRFSLDLLSQVADLNEGEGLDALDHLLSSRLVRAWRKGDEPPDERPYEFGHDKIRDVVYTEAGPARRVILHRRALAALETVQAPAAELAHHALAAGLKEEATLHSLAAGDEATKLVSTHEALSHYRRARELAEQLPIDRIGPQERCRLYLNYGRALELSARYDEALSIYENLETMGERLKDRKLILAGLMARAALHAIPTSVSDPVHAEALAEQALDLSRDLDDQAAEARLLWCLAHVYRVTSRNAQALEAAERSLALSRKMDLREQTALALNDLGSHGYLMNGQINQAQAALQEASALWRELGDLPMLADSLASLALVASMAGEYDQVLAFSDEANQISQSTDNIWGQAFSRMQVGGAFWERGQPDEALEAMEESIRLSEAAGFGVPQALTRATLAEIYGRLGAIEHGLELAQLALAAAASSVPHSDRFVRAVMAQLYILEQNLSEAEVALSKAKDGLDQEVSPIILTRLYLAECELANALGQYELARNVSDQLLAYLSPSNMRAYLPWARLLRGQALLGLGRRKAAQDCLLAARAEAEAIGSRQALFPILLALNLLEDDPEQTEMLRRQAREIVVFMLDHIKTPELRSSFLIQDHVQEVLMV